MEFVAIDVETANVDFSTICQIGIVHFKNGEVVDKWESLVNPETHFDTFTSKIHNVNQEDVKEAPTFKEIYPLLLEKIDGKIIVHHTPFDKIALTRICKKYELQIFDVKWLDSSIVVKRTWTQFSKKGYGLASIAKFLDIEFEHHNAIEDALVAGKIIGAACQTLDISFEELIEKTDYIPKRDYKNSSSKKIDFEINEEGQLFGEVILFTGSLSIVRVDAEHMAAEIGCEIAKTINKSVTMLVVGIQDEERTLGYNKSSKHRKAEELISKGATIQILSEDDFKELYESVKQ